MRGGVKPSSVGCILYMYIPIYMHVERMDDTLCRRVLIIGHET